MRLDRDEFAITYDPAKVAPAEIIATIKETGHAARVVSGKGKTLREPAVLSLPPGFALFDEALAQAQRDRKPVVLDFYAEWRAPCMRMEKNTFQDDRVKALLERCVFVRVDTDKQPDIAIRNQLWNLCGTSGFLLVKTSEGAAFGHYLGVDRRGAFKIRRRIGGEHSRDCWGWRSGVRDCPTLGEWVESSKLTSAWPYSSLYKRNVPSTRILPNSFDRRRAEGQNNPC